MTTEERIRAACGAEQLPAPLPSLSAAIDLAGREYAYRPSSFGGWMLLSRGADGGMHYRGSRPTRADAAYWTDVRVQELAYEIHDGEVLGSLLFWDRARRRWYLG